MFTFLEETLLREYFLQCAVLGEYAPNKQLFNCLTKAFDLSSRKANTLFNLTEQEAVREIATAGDANRYKRIAQFRQETGEAPLYDAQTDALITIKSEAIAQASRTELRTESKTTQSNVYQTLLDRAGSGLVDALRILGTLQLYGLFVDKNVAAGIDNLLKASQWGDVVSMLLLVRAGVDVDYVNRNFYAATRNTPYAALFDVANLQNAPELGQFSAEYALLNKLFNAKVVKRAIFSPAHAHVLYATGISREDKEKILLSENRQLLSDVVNLPIYSPATELRCQPERVVTILGRVAEQELIVTALQNRDLRTYTNYKPLCLAINSLYLQKLYAKAIENSFRGEMVERIYVSELESRDFEPTANNVFVRHCKTVSDNEGVVKQKNDTGNVFLLFLNGDLSDGVLKRVKEFLSTAWRRQVQLLHPSVTLNFSYALPIVICDAANAKKLKNLVETVHIADANAEESRIAIDDLLRKEASKFFGRSVEITDNAGELLAQVSLEGAEEILETAFKTLRAKYQNQDKVAFAIKPYVEAYKQQHGERSYGFGGGSK